MAYASASPLTARASASASASSTVLLGLCLGLHLYGVRLRFPSHSSCFGLSFSFQHGPALLGLCNLFQTIFLGLRRSTDLTVQLLLLPLDLLLLDRDLLLTFHNFHLHFLLLDPCVHF